MLEKGRETGKRSCPMTGKYHASSRPPSRPRRSLPPPARTIIFHLMIIERLSEGEKGRSACFGGRFSVYHGRVAQGCSGNRRRSAVRGKGMRFLGKTRRREGRGGGRRSPP